MSTDEKVKIYKNPERNKQAGVKPYIPQYQLKGVEPEVYNSPMAPGNVTHSRATDSLPKTNPRASRSMVRQPYAEAVPSPIGVGKGPIPNVGNNMEQTWSSVDGELIDDISEEMLGQPMIDNNDYVSEAALGLPEKEESTDDVDNTKKFLTKDELQSVIQNEEALNFSQLKEDEYVLIVDGSVVCSGDLENVQDLTRAMVFGENELWPNEPVSIDDIIILKRVKLKVGLFLE